MRKRSEFTAAASTYCFTPTPQGPFASSLSTLPRDRFARPSPPKRRRQTRFFFRIFVFGLGVSLDLHTVLRGSPQSQKCGGGSQHYGLPEHFARALTRMNKMQNENKKTIAPDANDFLGGNYLRKEDLSEPRTVTIVRVWSGSVQNSERPKLIVAFEELSKPLILNKTNTRILVSLFGTTTTTAWRGKVLLHVDQSVQFGGRTVGGIRLGQAKPVNGYASEPTAMNSGVAS